MEQGTPTPPVRRRYHPHTEAAAPDRAVTVAPSAECIKPQTESANPCAPDAMHAPSRYSDPRAISKPIPPVQAHPTENKPNLDKTSVAAPDLTPYPSHHSSRYAETESALPDSAPHSPASTEKHTPTTEHTRTSAPDPMRYPSQYSSRHTEQEASDLPPKTTPVSRKRLLYYLGIALCTVVLIASGSMLIRYYGQIHRANKASNQLRELYQETAAPSLDPAVTPTPEPTAEPEPAVADATPEPTAEPQPLQTAQTDDFLSAWPSRYPGNEQMRIQERFTPLRQQNREVVGWLSIEGVLDEPVFQRDNSYYLTHDATGAKNPTGALFLDENCNLRTVPMQVLIHGHNMKEGAMFGSLKKYKVKDASFYREHPFVQFDSLYESATYVIFAVAEVNIVPGNTHYYPFWHRFRFDDYESFRQYVSLIKEYSRYKVNIDVQPGDRLLTLATCSSGDDNLRLIVMARMLREDEDRIMLTNQIYSATAK